MGEKENMKISIITVCFNAESTIEQTLISVEKLKETENDVEYLVIDGKSKDKTNDIIMRHTEIIDQYISEPDAGLYDALNKGIRLATGEWIMLLAADDHILPNSLKLFRKTLKENTEIWCGSIICKDGDQYYLEHSNNRLEELKNNCVLRNPASLFKKEIFEKYGYYDTDFKCNGDGELFYRMYIRGVRFQIENVPMVIFGIGGMSTYDVTKYAIPERAMIYQKYNLMSEKEIEEWKKKAIMKAKIKMILKKCGAGQIVQKRGKQILSQEELLSLGVII